MRKMKKVISLALVGAMVFSLTACGEKGKTTPSAAPAGSGAPATEAPVSTEPVTIKAVTMMGGTDPNTEYYHKILDKMKTDYPYITVKDDSAVADQDWKNKVAADFSVGNEPDVIQFFTDANAKELLATDKFVKFDEIKAAYPDYAKDTSAGALKSASAPDGTSYAVPTTGFWEGLYCNKDLFDKFKVELPTDWDKMTKAVETFKKNKIVPIAVSLNNMPHYWLEHFLLSSAGADEYITIPKATPDSWVKGVEMFKTLRDMGAFPEDTDSADNDTLSNLFKEKGAAMQIDGSWYLGGITDQENTVVIGFPNIPGGKMNPGDGVSGFSSGFYITKKAWDDPAKRDAAVKFVMANTSKEAVADYWRGNGAAACEGLEAPANMTPLGKSGVAFANTITNPVAPTDARITPEAMTALVDTICGVSTGAQTAKDAVDAAMAVQNK